MGVQKGEKGGSGHSRFRRKEINNALVDCIFLGVWGGQKGKNISGALVRVLESASRAVKLNQPRVLPFLQRSKGGILARARRQ